MTFAVPVLFFCYPGMSLLDCLCREGGVGGQGGRCPRLVEYMYAVSNQYMYAVFNLHTLCTHYRVNFPWSVGLCMVCFQSLFPFLFFSRAVLTLAIRQPSLPAPWRRPSRSALPTVSAFVVSSFMV